MCKSCLTNRADPLRIFHVSFQEEADFRNKGKRNAGGQKSYCNASYNIQDSQLYCNPNSPKGGFTYLQSSA